MTIRSVMRATCICVLLSVPHTARADAPDPGACQRAFSDCRTRTSEERTSCRLGCPSDPVGDCGIPPLPSCIRLSVDAFVSCRLRCAAQNNDQLRGCVDDFISCRAVVAFPTPTPTPARLP